MSTDEPRTLSYPDRRSAASCGEEHSVASSETAPHAAPAPGTAETEHTPRGVMVNEVTARVHDKPVASSTTPSSTTPIDPKSSPSPHSPPRLDRSHTPMSISMPSLPALDPTDTPWDTNSLALLLPHQSLFAPDALQLLHDAFSAFGTLAAWAPVRAMGRVIIVYTEDRAAELAKKEGDGLTLQVDLDDEQQPQPQEQGEAHNERSYFSHQRKRSQNGIVLRVFALARTPLNATKDHLRPPEAERNFLISPPGSPPEGWEPIVEEGPNIAPLADDLRRALESLQLNGGRRGRAAGPEVILDEGGVRVEVEDADKTPTAEEMEQGGGWYSDVEDREWGEEEVQNGGPGIWTVPNQDGYESPTVQGRGLPQVQVSQTQATQIPSFGAGFDDLDSAGGFGGGGLGGRRGPLTPSGRIMPTARPPMPSN